MDEIKDAAMAGARQAIADQLPGVVHGIIRESVTRDPKRQLTEVGFGWALAIALQKHWPDISALDASRDLWGYLAMAKIDFGDPAYDWSYSAAEEIAREYAEAFGENPRNG